jgi:hypothetical protein
MVDVPATAAYFPTGLPRLRKFPSERIPELMTANKAAKLELQRRIDRKTGPAHGV